MTVSKRIINVSIFGITIISMHVFVKQISGHGNPLISPTLGEDTNNYKRRRRTQPLHMHANNMIKRYIFLPKHNSYL